MSPDTPPPVATAAADWLAGQGFTDAHRPGAHGNTPLMHTAWRGEAAVVEALLAQGVDLSACNRDGNNALWLACVADQPALVTRLVQAGVAIDHANLTGATCLMYAASSGKPRIVATLLALGAATQIKTQDDYTALDMAANLECLQLLRAATRDTARATSTATPP
jgi:ankyrin repeat protein